MGAIDLMAKTLQQSADMVQQTLADFTDQDMAARPCPGANHAAWQLTHLVQSEHHLLSAVGAMLPELTPEVRDLTKDAQKVDDPAKLPAKTLIMGERAKVRAATIAFVKMLKEQDLDDTKGGKLPPFAPTVGAVIEAVSMHDMMHMGQMQVIRRKLGKPVLY